MAQQTLDFVIAQQVTGHAEVTKLINSVGALDAEMKKIRAATGGMSAGFNQAAGAIKGNTNVLDAQSKALRNHRQGMQQAGMQVNDFVTSVSTGASPVQAFNQQIGQLGYAMSMMGGRAGAVGAFLAGPWSILVIGASMAIGFLMEGMFEAEKKAVNLEAASYKLGDAQSILGSMFDLATGRIREQNPVLITNAKLKIALAKIDAQRAQAEGKAELAEIRRGNIRLQGGFGGGLKFVREGDKTQSVVQNFRDGVISSTFAIAQLQNKLDAGLINPEEFTRAAVAIDKIAVAGEDLKAFDDAGKALNGSSEALQRFLRPAKEGGKVVREVKTEMDTFLESINRVDNRLDLARQAYENGSITLSQYRQEFEKMDKAQRDFSVNDKQLGFLRDGLKPIETFSDPLILSPLEQFQTEQKAIIAQAANIQRSYEAVGQAVADGFRGMITGAQSFGDAMRGVINAVIEELFRLYVVQQIVGMVSGALSGAFGSGASTPSDIASSFDATFPGRALGGSVGQNRPYLVGERGPELFMPGRSGTVIPTQNTRATGGGSTINVSVDARGATSPEMVRQQVQQGILEAAPSIVAAAEQRTISTLRRPRLAGVL